MIPKSEWQAVSHELMAKRRADGDPPTAEQILAYTRGELSGEDEEGVRELLVSYPDLARTLTEPVPDPRPGEPGYRSENEMTERWMSLQQRIGRNPSTRDGGAALHVWRAAAAVAATLAIISATMLWDARTRLSEPRIIADAHELRSAITRGAGSTAVLAPANGDALLTVQLTDQRFEQYRVDIVTAAGKSLWRSGLVRVGATGTLSIVVPHTFVKRGRYQIEIYGLSAAGEQHVDTYAIQWR